MSLTSASKAGPVTSPPPAGQVLGAIVASFTPAKAKTAAEWIKPAAFENCVKDCVKNGEEAVFVTEDNKTYKFDAASKDNYGRKK